MMKERCLSGLLALIAAVVSTPISALAGPVIDFDDLSDLTIVTNQYLSQGVLFSSSDGSLRIYEDSRAVSSPNWLLPNWLSGDQSALRIDFTAPASDVSLWVIDVGDWSVDIKAYDSTSGLLETVTVENPDDEIGYGNQDYIALSSSNISYITMQHGTDKYSFDGYGIDDLAFTAAVIPAPSAILLGSLGTSFVAYLRRRKSV
ncbi:MAG: hypothetical protein ACYS8Z_17930 [Planctomycetota bacterium]